MPPHLLPPRPLPLPPPSLVALAIAIPLASTWPTCSPLNRNLSSSSPPVVPPPALRLSLMVALSTLLPTAPAPSATRAPGGHLATSCLCRPCHRLQAHPPHHPSLLPFFFFIKSLSPPPRGLSLIKEHGPSPISCWHFEDLHPHCHAPR